MAKRATRSHSVTPEGLEQAQAKLRKFASKQAFADLISVSRSTVQNFFAGKPISQEYFEKICNKLDLSWEAIAGLEESESAIEKPAENIDHLVHEVRERVRSLTHEQCGTMRVLDMTQPIELTGDRGIYTNVNILERLTKHRRLEIEELLSGSSIEEFDRFGLSRITEKRVLGLKAVKQHSKLMVLGKPGAGKTTFLKYLAMACIEGMLLADRVPVFVTLKRFAEADGQPDLISYIRSIVNAEITDLLVSQGKLLVLLDGLDEVREEDTRRMIAQIEDFSRQYPKNQYVMTCRIAAKEYTFEKFTEVEVADFNDEQIATFVLNWFRCKDPDHAEERSTTLIKNLNNNEPIKELASNPLLLTLICLECEESLEFPKNRAELYDRGLRVLLKKWDESWMRERAQVYKQLALKSKENLLSQIAFTIFTEKGYFIKQRTLENYISDCIRNLPDVATNLEALQVDSEAVLKSIESQHGLLVERAKGIYSFSHLTFQEYFVAREMINRSDYQPLLENLGERRWREIALLAVNMLPDGTLLKQMKQQIDSLMAGDKRLQQCLTWIMQKSVLVEASYSPAVIRALYLELVDRAGDFEVILAALTLAKAFRGSVVSHHSLAFVLAPNLDLDCVQNFELDRKFMNILAYNSDSLNPLSLRLDLEVTNAMDLVCSNHEFRDKLQEARDQLPNEKNLDNFEKWWKENGQAWTEQLRKTTIEHRNIGHDWQFSDEQKALLQQYYDANKLLVDCLNSDCYVSRGVRQEIEETLLLPISEIEKRKTK